MIYVTGDLHGDISRFKAKAFKKLKKGDYLIVCGDFGFVWDGSAKEQRLLKWIGKRKYTVLFVEGIHDNLDLLNNYPVTEWNGGLVHEISGNLRHLCRGQIFTLDDRTIFAFGGGESGDTENRSESWLRYELPSPDELNAARERLDCVDYHIDYVITHQCSRSLKSFLAMNDNEANVLDTFLDFVRTHCKYKRWFFGSYHMNKVIPPHEYAIFDAVTPIQSDKLKID